MVDNSVSSQTKELYQLDIKEEIQDDYWEQPLSDNFDKEDIEDEKSNIKEEEMSRFTFSNSNYYYDDQNYNISGAEEDEDEENDNLDGYDNEDYGIDESREDGDFLKQSDSIEISDEDTSPKSTFSIKTNKINSYTHAKEEKDEADLYFYKCTVCSLAFGQRIDLLKHMRSHKKEGNKYFNTIYYT